jgi:dTMP kinase
MTINKQRGKYIVIEGCDGTGKSTQVDVLIEKLTKMGVDVIKTSEPGGTDMSFALRGIIKNKNYERDPWTNVLLFTIARRLNWTQLIEPNLKKGTWVISSRNWISTAVYQGYGEGINLDKIVEATKSNVADDYLTPDFTLILSLPSTEYRFNRLINRNETNVRLDEFESRSTDFQTKLEAGYLKIAEQYNFPVIDASKNVDEISNQILNIISIKK